MTGAGTNLRRPTPARGTESLIRLTQRSMLWTPRPEKSCGPAAIRSHHGIISAESPRRMAGFIFRRSTGCCIALQLLSSRSRHLKRTKNMKISRYIGMATVFAAVLAGVVWAQLGGLATQEWSTSGGDAQRSSWIRKDALISKSAMSTGQFGFLWKLKVNNQPRQLSYFSRPALVGNAMGIKGFRSLTVLAGASNTVFAVDNDFGVMYWEKHFDAAIPASSTVPCPGGMTAAATRATNPNPEALASGRPGIRSPYRS